MIENLSVIHKPLWLLDIDGVVNAYAYAKRKPNTWKWAGEVSHKRLTTESGTFPIWVADELVAFINKAHSSGLVDIAWCTTWADEANSIFAPAFGLPELPVAVYPDDSSYIWKHKPAYEALKSGRRLIWTDDDAVDSKAWTDLLDLTRSHPALTFKEDLLIIEPNGKVGLTPDDCSRIATFLGL